MKRFRKFSEARRRIARAGFLAAAVVFIIIAAVSCKLRGGTDAEPDGENLHEAVRAYLMESGLEEVEPGRFQKTLEDGTTEIHILDDLPRRIDRIPCEDYPCQGLMVRNRVVRSGDGTLGEPQKLFVIMWWSRKEGGWVHLTGSNIPEVDYDVK